MWKDMWNADKILPWNHQWVGTVEISATGITSWFFFSEASGSEPQNVWTANPVQTPELASDREAVLGVPPHYSLTSLVSPAPYLWGLAPLSISRLLTWWWYLAPIRCRPIHLFWILSSLPSKKLNPTNLSLFCVISYFFYTILSAT